MESETELAIEAVLASERDPIPSTKSTLRLAGPHCVPHSQEQGYSGLDLCE